MIINNVLERILLLVVFGLFSKLVFTQPNQGSYYILSEDTHYVVRHFYRFGKSNNVECFKHRISFSEKKRIDAQNVYNWHKLSFTDSGLFSMDIKGIEQQTDWDFLLLKEDSNKLFCEYEKIRFNFSRGFETGLSDSSKNKFVGFGVNPTYSKSVNVLPHSVYWLLVNTPSKKPVKGYIISTHFLKYVIPKTYKSPIIKTQVVKKQYLQLDLQNDTGKQLICNVLVIYKTNRYRFDSTSIIKLPLFLMRKSLDLLITPLESGYPLVSREYKIKEREEVIQIKGLKDIKQFNTRGVNFKPGSSELLEGAYPILDELYKFLNINTFVECTIEGHVNGEGKDKKYYKSLSNKRAEVVRRYLINKGVASDRLKYKGYGNTKMIYRRPISEQQRIANRRVSIKIR